MRLSKPFIKLPFRFDAKRLTEEASQFSNHEWMPHPNKLKGNSAIALVSKDGGDNNDFDGEKKVTPHLKRCAYLQQVMASFNEVLARSRLMKLDAHSEVSLHVDFNYHWFNRTRIHIPITTHPDVMFYCGQEAVHMQAGECWIFDHWRRHRVVNQSSQERIHLVIDTAGSSRFWQLVDSVKHLSMATLDAQSTSLEYQPGKDVEIRTERYSALPIMTPGECDALIADLIADFSQNSNNPTELTAKYRALLRGFAQDWREAWSLHGHSSTGPAAYRQLIATTRNKLHPDMRALTTASNDISVNAIFVQRVLNAALIQNEFPHWNIEPSEKCR